jgi:hypothetical protein
VDANAAQKDRLAIQQNLGAARFDGAEADQIFDRILARANLTL